MAIKTPSNQQKKFLIKFIHLVVNYKRIIKISLEYIKILEIIDTRTINTLKFESFLIFLIKFDFI